MSSWLALKFMSLPRDYQALTVIRPNYVLNDFGVRIHGIENSNKFLPLTPRVYFAVPYFSTSIKLTYE